MSKITFNSIYDGVSLLLHHYYPTAQIHGGNVKQGLRDGDFNVIIPISTHTGEMGIRARREPVILIRYYPSDVGGYAECAAIADILTTLLGSITTPEGDVVHGGAMRWEVVDGVMHFIITYRHLVFVAADEQPDEMENMRMVTDTLLADEDGSLLTESGNKLVTRNTW